MAPDENQAPHVQDKSGVPLAEHAAAERPRLYERSSSFRSAQGPSATAQALKDVGTLPESERLKRMGSEGEAAQIARQRAKEVSTSPPFAAHSCATADRFLFCDRDRSSTHLLVLSSRRRSASVFLMSKCRRMPGKISEM